MPITPERAEFATTMFFRECTRQYMRLHPGQYQAGDMPIQALASYSPSHQRAMIEAIRVAVEAATGTSMDELFLRFLKDKVELGALNAQAYHAATGK